MIDVAVVGAGPSGLHAACRLAAAGLDVALYEAQARIGEGAICSGVISEEAFGRFDLPTRPVLTRIRTIQAFSPAGRIMEHRSEHPLARVVDKSEFNRALGERAYRAGAEILLNRRVESAEPERDSVALGVRGPEGSNETVRARVVVIASGVNSCLARQLGLARPRQMLRAMQTEVTTSRREPSRPTRVYVGRSVAAGAFGWEIPLGDGRARVGIMSTADPKPFFKNLLDRIEPNLAAGDVKVGQKGIAQASVGRCVADRILAVGEAAGHVKTSTGGGIYYGLLSAEFAAETILRAFTKGDFSTTALACFERYWRTAFGKELLVGYFARALASSLPDTALERVFDWVNTRKILKRVEGILKFDWHQKALTTTLSHWMLLARGMGHG